MEGVERKGGEEETVIISFLSCESQPVLQSLQGKLEMHTNCLYSESVLPDSTEAFCFVFHDTCVCVHLLSKESKHIYIYIYY